MNEYTFTGTVTVKILADDKHTAQDELAAVVRSWSQTAPDHCQILAAVEELVSSELDVLGDVVDGAEQE
jgi:hypothetical protein